MCVCVCVCVCRIARDPRFERLPCMHKGTYADDCLINRVTQVGNAQESLHNNICLLIPVSDVTASSPPLSSSTSATL